MGRVRDYSKTVIYRIVDIRYNITIYIGHTTNLYEKKKHLKRNKFGINNFVRDQGGWKNFRVLYLECYPQCCSQAHAEALVYRVQRQHGIPDENELENVFNVYSNENIQKTKTLEVL